MPSISGGLTVTGGLTADTFSVPAGAVSNTSVASGADIATDKIAQRSLAAYMLDFASWRVWDAMATLLPGSGANDDLGFAGTAFGLVAPSIVFTSISNTTATRRARFLVMLPAGYDAGNDIQIRFRVVRSNQAQVSATIDLEAGYFNTASGSLLTDACATAAIDINSAGTTDADFVITATGKVAGDLFDCRVSIAADDTGGTGANFSIISAFLLCDTRG